jgi:16S rRNA (adenine1518-N6/adenine1519-N6)-dimethyltransferase
MSMMPPSLSHLPQGTPAALLRRLGLHARKSLSQSFLTDQRICRAMADAADLCPEDDVLEIGPGLGILTRILLARARQVIAVELDPVLASHLPALAPGGCLKLLQGDALEFDPAEHFAGSYKLVANLPYQITSPALTRYLTQVRRPEVLVVMLQKEVAERIAAGPGRASYLSILVHSLADVRLVLRVPPGAFYPRPKVVSAVLRIRPLSEPDVPEELLSDFLQLVRAGFTQPRKTLANSLAQGLGVPRQLIERRIAAAGLEPRVRSQHLATGDWLALLRTPTRQA